MISKYIVFATAILLTLSSVSMVTATLGTYTPPTSVGMSGPLVNQVIFSICGDEASCSGSLIGGNIQAPEWTFSIGAYTSMCPPPQGTGTHPEILCGQTISYSWFGLAFNFWKFPGNNVNFRRAIQFLQDYGYIQSTILQGVEGYAANAPTYCGAYVSACNPTPMTTHYGTAQNLVAAGQELEMVNGGTAATTLFCNNGATHPCAGSYNAGSTWCTGNYCTMGGTPFAPNLYYRTTLYRNLWGAAMINWGSQIGLTFNGHLTTGGGVGAVCFNPNAAEIPTTPGSYIATGANAGYNTDPVANMTAVAADNCDMYTFGFISSAPILNGLLESYNSQFAGTTTNTGNAYDDPAFTSAADAVAAYATPTAHTTINNLDYTTNKVLYAADAPTAYTWAQSFMNAYALSLPNVFGYYLSTLYADNSNGWTGFANVPVTGPDELGGLYYTFLNVHPCGSATCTIDGSAANGGYIGGNFQYALEMVGDQSGLNPLYNGNWVWQADVFENIFDTALAIPPTHFSDVNYYVDYMTSSHSIASFTGAVPTGGSMYYFQQPCAAALPAATFAARMLACQAKSFTAPSTRQHGIGLSATADVAAGGRHITGGQVITLTLKPGIYFFDGVQVTAKDLIFSLDFFNVAASPNYPDSGSPASGVLGGALGLIAAKQVNTYTIQIYMGSASFWNLGNVVSYVMPQHIWKYFNPDHVSTVALGTVDTTKPYGIGATAYSTQGATPPPISSWIYWLNNLEIGSGPFWLSSWNTGSGTGEIDANPYYFNPNWQAIAAQNYINTGSQGAINWYSYIGSPSIIKDWIHWPNSGPGYPVACQTAPYCITMTFYNVIPIYNPGPPLTCGPQTPNVIGTGSTGMCQLKGTMPGVSWPASGANKLKVYNSQGVLVKSLSATKSTTTGGYTVEIPVGLSTKTGVHCTSLSATCTPLSTGSYKVVWSTTYTFHGQARVWFEIDGFSIP